MAIQWCNVYWGSHGCLLPKGHPGDHWCDCCECPLGTHPNGDPEYKCAAGPPYYGPELITRFYGEDA